MDSALKTEVLGQTRSTKADPIILARLHWGKNNSALSLHVNPNTHSTSGLQTPDFLSYLGFERSNCSFTAGRQCYVRRVEDGFDLGAFTKHFDAAFEKLLAAESDLGRCGFSFEQPEGWGYFYGKSSGVSRPNHNGLSGDGHTAQKIQPIKQSEDVTFQFRFTWLESAYEKGWVIPKKSSSQAAWRCTRKRRPREQSFRQLSNSSGTMWSAKRSVGILIRHQNAKSRENSLLIPCLTGNLG